MYNTTQLQQAFSGLVGFYQPDDPAYTQIKDVSLLASSSGKYVQAIHPLATLENVQNCAPDFTGFAYKPYSATESYPKDTIVLYNDQLYRAIIVTTQGTDPTNTTTWALTNPYTEWIKSRIYNAAVNNLASDLTKIKAITNAGRSLLDVQQLYQGFGGFNDRIVKKGRFVGFEIAVSRNAQIAAILNNVGFQADGPVNGLEMHLFHTSRLQEVGAFTINVSAGGNFEWTPVEDIIFGFLAQNYDTTGTFYLGYYEDDLPEEVQAISRVMDISRPPCGSCGNFNISAYNAWSKYVKIAAVEFPAGSFTTGQLPETDKITYRHDTNFGLNLQLSVQCDLTPLFIQQKSLFADALAARIVVEILNLLAFNTRINAISDKTKQLAMAELDPDPKKGTFLGQYLLALKELNINFSGFNSSCLPVHDNAKRINFHAI